MNMPTQRIVSLCPSTTRTLFDLGLIDSIIARTQYCETFDKEKSIATVGGTKTPQWDRIRSMNPTHILFNLEENDANHLQISQSICETIVHTPTTLLESREFVIDLGARFGCDVRAEAISNEMDYELEKLIPNQRSFSFLYFIWHPNKRVAGINTYIDDMLTAIGGTNLAGDFSEERYPTIPDSFEKKADVVFLASEPFEYKTEHIPEYQSFGGRVFLIDGEPVCWKGSYTAKGLRYLKDFSWKNLKF